jgi:hypothetical protein
MGHLGMQLRFLKADSGYIAVSPIGAPCAVGALRLPWQVSVDSCTLRNELHGENMHLLTGIWNTHDSTIVGRTLIDRDIEINVRVTWQAQGATGACRFELSMVNRSSMTHAAPAVVVGFDLPPPPRRVQLRATDLHVTAADGMSWWLRPANGVAHDPGCCLRSPNSRSPTADCMMPTLERARRDLVSITLPMGPSLAPFAAASASGELTVSSAGPPAAEP